MVLQSCGRRRDVAELPGAGGVGGASVPRRQHTEPRGRNTVFLRRLVVLSVINSIQSPGFGTQFFFEGWMCC